MSQEITASESTQAYVRKWLRAIEKAARLSEPDFKRMRADMEFAAGYQWKEQEDLEENRYIANMANQIVQKKTAALYAKKPTAVYERRPRLDFSLWDGDIASLQMATMRLQMDPFDTEAQAILLDYQEGNRTRKMIERVGETLEIAYQYQMDRQPVSTILRMKQMVRRTVTTGVGYVRVDIEREEDDYLSAEPGRDIRKAKRAVAIQKELVEGDRDEDGAEASEMEVLAQQEPGIEGLREALHFTYPQATRIIVDPNCTALKGFVDAKWIAQRYSLTLEDVNAIFGMSLEASQLKPSESETEISVEGENPYDPVNAKEQDEIEVNVYEVFDRESGTTFIVLEGWPEHLTEPEPVEPQLFGFWTIKAVTFNDVEVEDGQKASIYPPSDVRLMWSAQKEHNRQREELRAHRVSNRPIYLTAEGWLTESDQEELKHPLSNAVIKLQGVPPGTDLNTLLVPFRHAPIDPALYDSGAVKEDILLTTGAQEANLGPLTGATATESTIAEQSRMTAGASNVDDLDELLSALAEAGGEAMLRGFSLETIQRIVGRGATWPQGQMAPMFLNEIFLKTEAASSGRPNKAVDVSNFERLMPLLLQAGANPASLVREAAKLLFDGRVDANEFLPVAPPALGATPATPRQAPVPLPGE